MDYKGYRVVGQSIIPGLFTEHTDSDDEEIKIAYGSLDQKKLSVDETFHEYLVSAAEDLHIKVCS